MHFTGRHVHRDPAEGPGGVLAHPRGKAGTPPDRSQGIRPSVRRAVPGQPRHRRRPGEAPGVPAEVPVRGRRRHLRPLGQLTASARFAATHGAEPAVPSLPCGVHGCDTSPPSSRTDVGLPAPNAPHPRGRSRGTTGLGPPPASPAGRQSGPGCQASDDGSPSALRVDRPERTWPSPNCGFAHASVIPTLPRVDVRLLIACHAATLISGGGRYPGRSRSVISCFVLHARCIVCDLGRTLDAATGILLAGPPRSSCAGHRPARCCVYRRPATGLAADARASIDDHPAEGPAISGPTVCASSIRGIGRDRFGLSRHLHASGERHGHRCELRPQHAPALLGRSAYCFGLQRHSTSCLRRSHVNGTLCVHG